jgi:hypothetical protein
VDYKIKEGVARNLWVRGVQRSSTQDEQVGGDDFFDFRIIVNWDFSAP